MVLCCVFFFFRLFFPYTRLFFTGMVFVYMAHSAKIIISNKLTFFLVRSAVRFGCLTCLGNKNWKEMDCGNKQHTKNKNQLHFSHRMNYTHIHMYTKFGNTDKRRFTDYYLFGRRSAISLSHSVSISYTHCTHTHEICIRTQIHWYNFSWYTKHSNILYDCDCTHFQARSDAYREANESDLPFQSMIRRKSPFIYTFKNMFNTFQLANEPGVGRSEPLGYAYQLTWKLIGTFWKCVIDGVWYHYHNINIFMHWMGHGYEIISDFMGPKLGALLFLFGFYWY